MIMWNFIFNVESRRKSLNNRHSLNNRQSSNETGAEWIDIFAVDILSYQYQISIANIEIYIAFRSCSLLVKSRKASYKITEIFPFMQRDHIKK